MLEFTFIQQICIWALPIILAVTLHEVAHGYVAFCCGDNTAKSYGRLSLNPIRHIDLFGTIIIPLLIGFFTNFNFLFGYAKPVPINWGKLRHPKRDMILVALAGPIANLIMAFLWMGLFKIAILLKPESSMAALFLLMTARAGMMMNLFLAFLNLIPIPPLDGSRVVLALLSPQNALRYLIIEPYGFFIIALLALSGVLAQLLAPLLNLTLAFFRLIYQL
jgi:Zn-dependent protease